MSDFPRQPLKHLAAVSVSNVDKKSVEGDHPVRLVNYTDVYYGDRITPALPLMDATATTDQLKAFHLRPGDVAITKDSETADDIGIAAFIDESAPDLLLGYHLALLRPRRPVMDPRFLYWCMRSDLARGQMSSGATGVTRFGLRQDVIASMFLPIPEPDAQRAIADFLDTETTRIDALVAKKRRMIDLLNERRWRLLENLASAAVGTESTALKHLAVVFTDGDWIESPYITSAGIRLIQTGNIGRGIFRDQGNRFISEETFIELNCTEVYPGDVLVSRLANTVGQACIAPDLGCRMVTSVDVVIMRPSRATDSRYLVRYMSSERHLSRARLEARGTTMQRLARSQVGELPVPVVALDLQRRLVEETDRAAAPLTRGVTRLEQQITLLQEHRQALITAAVTGELDIPGLAA